MKLLQPSLSAGEIAPGLQGRVDLARYAVGLRTARNVITLPSGGARKRTGFRFRGEVKSVTLPEGETVAKYRLLPFLYSTSVRYLLELGHQYMRFWFVASDDSLAQMTVDTPSVGTIYEISTPWQNSDLADLRITQSADVLYIVHRLYPPMELRRLAADSFELREFENREGPFRAMNANDGFRVAVSAATGTVTVAANSDTFLAEHVGALLYLEEQELRDIAPWEPAQKNVSVGSLRRSDGKVYRASAVSSGGTFYVTGSVRPVHEVGRAWDGGKDTRSDGVNNYTVGVEWEYIHAGYGIVRLTAFTDAKTMTGLVLKRCPDSVVGTPTAARDWTFSGNGSTKVFSITGAVSSSTSDYTVKIGGVGVQP